MRIPLLVVGLFAALAIIPAGCTSDVVGEGDESTEASPGPGAATIPGEPVPSPTPAAGDSIVAEYCASDTDCIWDDHCAPTTCLHHLQSSPEVQRCGETLPPPGTCSCVASRCTLRRTGLAATNGVTPGCAESGQCAFEPSTGSCRPASGAAQPPIEVSGAFCRCGEARDCVIEWVDPVPCATFAECGWREGPLRPVPTTAPRTAPREACVDGEFDSICAGGFCRIVVWGC